MGCTCTASRIDIASLQYIQCSLNLLYYLAAFMGDVASLALAISHKFDEIMELSESIEIHCAGGNKSETYVSKEIAEKLSNDAYSRFESLRENFNRNVAEYIGYPRISTYINHCSFPPTLVHLDPNDSRTSQLNFQLNSVHKYDFAVIGMYMERIDKLMTEYMNFPAKCSSIDPIRYQVMKYDLVEENCDHVITTIEHEFASELFDYTNLSGYSLPEDEFLTTATQLIGQWNDIDERRDILMTRVNLIGKNRVDYLRNFTME